MTLQTTVVQPYINTNYLQKNYLQYFKINIHVLSIIINNHVGQNSVVFIRLGKSWTQSKLISSSLNIVPTKMQCVIIFCILTMTMGHENKKKIRLVKITIIVFNTGLWKVLYYIGDTSRNKCVQNQVQRIFFMINDHIINFNTKLCIRKKKIIINDIPYLSVIYKMMILVLLTEITN